MTPNQSKNLITHLRAAIHGLEGEVGRWQQINVAAHSELDRLGAPKTLTVPGRIAWVRERLATAAG